MPSQWWPTGGQGVAEHPMELQGPPRRRQAAVAAAHNAQLLLDAIKLQHRLKAANQSRLPTNDPALCRTP